MADGWIEFFDVETDEAEVLFVFDRFEPVDYGCGVFPLVEAAFFRDCVVDAVEEFLIICRPELSTLNKRNELVSSCRHRNKALLRNN